MFDSKFGIHEYKNMLDPLMFFFFFLQKDFNIISNNNFVYAKRELDLHSFYDTWLIFCPFFKTEAWVKVLLMYLE